MPRQLSVTRATRAATLRKRVIEGPAFSYMDFHHEDPLTPERAAEIASFNYRLWANSWVLPDLDILVPELRKRDNS